MVDLEASLEKITTFKTFEKGYLCRCPFAPKTHTRSYDKSPSLVIWGEIDFYQCYSCGQRGHIKELFLDLAKLIPSNLHEELAVQWQDSLWHVRSRIKEREDYPLVKLDEGMLQFFPPVYGEGKQYLLEKRGIDNSAIEHYDIRFDERSNRVVFPLRTMNKDLVGFVGRDIARKGHYKYMAETSKLLGGEDKLKYERIVVVEGFMDVLKCWPWANELGLDVVCCWTATLSRHQIKTLAKLDKFVYLMLDQDAAGNKGAAKFGKEYPGLCTRLEWDFLNSKGEVADVGDMNETQFKGCF